MKRAECIDMLYPELPTSSSSRSWARARRSSTTSAICENFFYLQHAMGLASSIGLGLALHLPDERIVVLDGDGSVLMNLGTLATLARYRPRNLVHIVFDNGSLLSTGGFDSHTTSGLTDLAAMARGAGIAHVAAVDSVVGFGEAVIDAFARDDFSVIVAKVAAVGPNHYGMDLQLPENAFRFKRLHRRAEGPDDVSQPVYVVSARTRNGLPLPFTILSGAAITMAPVAGS